MGELLIVFGQPFYFEIIRKVSIAFGTLFNNVHLIRRDPTTSAVIDDITVPISFVNRQHYIAKLKENQTSFDAVLPRMTFDVVDISYDSSRQSNSSRPITAASTIPNAVKRQLNSTPYNLTYDLSIFAKNMEDGLQMIEQILPFFAPHMNVTIKTVPEMGIVQDFSVKLSSISKEDNAFAGFDENRVIRWTLSFEIPIVLFPPITDGAQIIHTANVPVRADTPLATTPSETVIDTATLPQGSAPPATTTVTTP